MNADTRIIRITRTRSGLRLWFSDTSVVGMKFVYTICDDNSLLLDEVDPAGPGITVLQDNRTDSALWSASTLHGPKFGQMLSIAPTVVGNRSGWVIPGIPDLVDHRQQIMHVARPLNRGYGKVPPDATPSEHGPHEYANVNEAVNGAPAPVHAEWVPPEPLPWPVEPTIWTVESIRKVLSEVRSVEARTGYKLTRDEAGLAVFTAPAITL